MNNLFHEDLDIPQPHHRDHTIPILNLDQITISGANISGYRELLTTTIDNTPPHYITCYTDG